MTFITRKRRKSTKAWTWTPSILATQAASVVDVFNTLKLPSTLNFVAQPDITLTFHTGPTLSAHLHSALLADVSTLRQQYDASQMPWDPNSKAAELRHPDHRLILASHPSIPNRPAAFIAFRWDVEDDHPIMYVYELFVTPSLRGRRVASALMRFAEALCISLGIFRILLTVFDTNIPALKLYRRTLGYQTDPSSPELHGFNEQGYQILRKQLDPNTSATTILVTPPSLTTPSVIA